MADGIDRAAIKRLMDGIQREVDKHPIRVPLQADGELPAAATVNNYNGPTVVMTGDGAQAVAWNSGTVNQGQTQTIASGYEVLADLVTRIQANLDALSLEEGDSVLVQESTVEVLQEVTSAEPDRGRIRRAVTMIRGVLSPVAAGLGRAATDESAQLAHKLIEDLTQAIT